MYLNNNSKFSDQDRYAKVNTSDKNTIENFTQKEDTEAIQTREGNITNFCKPPKDQYNRIKYIRIKSNNWLMMSQVTAKSKDGTNISKGKPCTSSGPYQGRAANKCDVALDGHEKMRMYTKDKSSIGNDYGVFHSKAKADSFWEVDLGDSGSKLESITIHNRKAQHEHNALGDATLQVLDKDKKVLWEKKLLGDGEQTLHVFSPQYIRIKSNNWLMMSQVTAKSKDGTNISKGKPCTSSGPYQGRAANKCDVALDGHEKMRMYTKDKSSIGNDYGVFHSKAKADSFWEVDLGDSGSKLESITIHNRKAKHEHKALGDATLQVLDKDKKVLWEKKLLGNETQILNCSENKHKVMLSKSDFFLKRVGDPTLRVSEAECKEYAKIINKPFEVKNFGDAAWMEIPGCGLKNTKDKVVYNRDINGELSDIKCGWNWSCVTKSSNLFTTKKSGKPPDPTYNVNKYYCKKYAETLGPNTKYEKINNASYPIGCSTWDDKSIVNYNDSWYGNNCNNGHQCVIFSTNEKELARKNAMKRLFLIRLREKLNKKKEVYKRIAEGLGLNTSEFYKFDKNNDGSVPQGFIASIKTAGDVKGKYAYFVPVNKNYKKNTGGIFYRPVNILFKKDNVYHRGTIIDYNKGTSKFKIHSGNENYDIDKVNMFYDNSTIKYRHSGRVRCDDARHKKRLYGNEQFQFNYYYSINEERYTNAKNEAIKNFNLPLQHLDISNYFDENLKDCNRLVYSHGMSLKFRQEEENAWKAKQDEYNKKMEQQRQRRKEQEALQNLMNKAKKNDKFGVFDIVTDVGEGLSAANDWVENAKKDTGDWVKNAAKDTGEWFKTAAADTGNWFTKAGQDTDAYFTGLEARHNAAYGEKAMSNTNQAVEKTEEVVSSGKQCFTNIDFDQEKSNCEACSPCAELGAQAWYIGYTLIVQQATYKQLLSGLLISFILGMLTEITEQSIKNEINKLNIDGLTNELNSKMEDSLTDIEDVTSLKIDRSKVNSFIENAIINAFECTLRAIGMTKGKATVKEGADHLKDIFKAFQGKTILTAAEKKNLKANKFFMDIIHRFNKCLGKEIIRLIMKDITKCDGPCNIKTDLALEILN